MSCVLTSETLARPGARLGRRAALALLALCLAVSADSAVIYRWVDKQGKTHFGDVVPNEYKDVAKPVDQTAPSPSAEEQRRATERAAKEKARAAEAPAAASAAGASSPAGSAASSPKPSRRPPYAPTDTTDCETWRRLYRESLECFGPYRTARGATKAEAFEHCTPVLEPPIRCGRNAQ